MTLEQLRTHDFTLTGINALRQHWTEDSIFTFRRTARTEHGLIYLSGCDARFETRAGQTVTARRGDLIYLAKGSGYIVRFFNVIRQPATLLVNFQLTGPDGDPLLPDAEVLALPIGQAEAEPAMVELTDEYYAPVYSPAAMKGRLYRILAEAGRRLDLSGSQTAVPHALEPALRLLDENSRRNVTVRELAAACHLSESGFRKRFTDYTGQSPTEYRLTRRIEQAKRLLKAGSASVGEIAFSLGFDDLNYFCRLFRRKTGMTPGDYKKRSDLC